jgi:hypothetical protein
VGEAADVLAASFADDPVYVRDVATAKTQRRQAWIKR